MDLKRFNFLPADHKKLVFGFIHKIQQQLPNNITIPIIIYQLCGVLYQGGCWETQELYRHSQYKINGNIIESTGDQRATAFIVDEVSKGKHKWKFRLIKGFNNAERLGHGLIFGVCKVSTNPSSQSVLDVVDPV